MNIIIKKTFELIDALEESDLIKDLTNYKEKAKENKKLMSLLTSCQKQENENSILKYRKEIYSYNEYRQYMKNYSQLSLIILKINNGYKKYTSDRKCIKMR